MRALAAVVRREWARERKKEKKRRERAEARKLLDSQEQSTATKSLEWKLLRRKYPGTLFRSLIIKKVHPDLRFRFRAKCAENGFTMSGKIRKLVVDFVAGKIDNNRLEDQMYGINPIKIFGKFPDEGTHTVTCCSVPRKIHLQYHKWCALRGTSMSWKTKQLKVAHLIGHID
jgi:hypothetical protein